MAPEYSERVLQRMRLTLGVTLSVSLLFSTACNAPPPPEGAETVVVVHGLGRTATSMALLVARLQEAGYRVVNFGYPSTKEPIEELVARLDEAVTACCAEAPEGVHFVSHSMGGILVHRYLAGRESGHLGRVVMLSPPNQGSEIIDAFADSPLLPIVLGPSGAALGTDGDGIAFRLDSVNFRLGVITGNRSMSPIGSWIIPGPDDGKVAVERARSEGAADFLVVPATHTFIMNRRDVADQTTHFLRDGRFER